MKRRIVEFLRRYATDQPDDHAIDLIQHIADTVDRMDEPIAKRVREVVSFVPHGTVTHKVWVCEHCRARVTGKDKFCHECGWILSDVEELTELQKRVMDRTAAPVCVPDLINPTDTQYNRRWP